MNKVYKSIFGLRFTTMSVFFLGYIISSASLLAQEDPNDRFEQEMKKAGKTREVDGVEMDEEQERATFKDRLKNARQTPKIEANAQGGFFVAGQVGVGQAYSSEPKSNPGFSILAGIEPGYVVQSSNFNRLEFGLMAFSGTTAFSDEKIKSSVPISFGLAPRFGYGYSLGSGIFGVMRVLAGVSQGRLNGKAKISDATVTSDPVLGFVIGGGWDMVFEMSKSVELLAGLSITHFQYKFDNIKVDGSTVKGEEVVVNMNIPQIQVGARFRF